MVVAIVQLVDSDLQVKGDGLQFVKFRLGLISSS
ncbi:hypothetical protein C5167_034754 [Papaver somniferum]|uniref:Uncharacterized protein n=1 Tax=Papaver somniferum TaxID=3469 RepID=A0A4Y7KI76_PAPSO|nr:hypothetical protein C5167_034754 [Papaver somniferum]